MKPISDKFRIYFMQLTVELALDDARAMQRFLNYEAMGLNPLSTKNISFIYRNRVVAIISLTQVGLYTDVVANWLDDVAIPLAKDWYDIMHERLDMDIPKWIQSLSTNQTSPVELPATLDSEAAPIKIGSRRIKNKRMRIIAGLARWRATQIGVAVDNVCHETKLLSASSFYSYQREELLYSDADIKQLGVTWSDLWSAFTRGKLEEYIKEILE